jgi:hypothetical protein
MDISIAFRASSGRHSLILPALSEGRDSPNGQESTTTLVSNQINLPASAGICNSLFPTLLAHASLHFYAENVPATARRETTLFSEARAFAVTFFGLISVDSHTDPYRTKRTSTQG